MMESVSRFLFKDQWEKEHLQECHCSLQGPERFWSLWIGVLMVQLGSFINIGSIGGKEVDEVDDIFILVAPQNAMGNCIIDDLRAMTDAAGSRPVILINPRLKDLPASSGIMQTMGREQRLEYAASFEMCYQFRLLYYAGTQYPIMGALRMAYPYRYELFKRVNDSNGKEKYVILSTFPSRPTGDEINDAFEGRTRDKVKKSSGFWGFLSGILST